MTEFLDPEEGDLTTADHVHFYQYGRLALTLMVSEQSRPGETAYVRVAKEGELSDDAMWMQLRAYMKRENFYPNVWFISDHGNAHLMQRRR